MAKISLEEREKQGEQIVDFFIHKEWEGRELIWQVYNHAIRDALKAIDTYINKNPQHSRAFTALYLEMEKLDALTERMIRQEIYDEHEHEYQLDVQGKFYYCEFCGEDLTIQDLLKAHIENQTHIKALEGVVENVRKYLNHKEETPRHIIDIYIENALKKLEEV